MKTANHKNIDHGLVETACSWNIIVGPSLEVIGSPWPPLLGKAIKATLSCFTKNLSPRFYSSPVNRGWISATLTSFLYWLKTCQVKFYLRQTEDYSLRDSTSDSSERLLQRGGGGRSIYKILVKGNSVQLSTHFTKGFLLSRRIWGPQKGI